MTFNERLATLQNIIDGEFVPPDVRKEVGEWVISTLSQIHENSEAQFQPQDPANDSIYIITLGQATSREVIISTPEHCTVLFRHKDSEMSIWTEGLTAEEGRILVAQYLRGNIGVWFGHTYSDLKRRKINEGFSERGKYTLEEFRAVLAEQDCNAVQYAESAYKAVFDKRCGIAAISQIMEGKCNDRIV